VTIPENLKQAIVEDGRRLAGGGASLEMILLFFRERGFDKIDSINSIRVLYGKSVSEAKDIIDGSETWSDRFHSDAQFHEAAWEALREIAASGDPSLPKIIIEGDSRR